ncbi:MAG: hypothetical protein AAB758_02545 [Patescibacteria group bacterium]
MREKIKKIWAENQKVRKFVGVILIIIGLGALVTPFTPGSWLIFVGLELFGLRFLFWEKIRSNFRK